MEELLAVGVQEAARLLSVCPRTVSNLIRAKQLPSRRIGRRRILRVKDLRLFLQRDHASPGKVTVGGAA